MKARFVTATGTGVGKTLVTAALAYQGRQRGLRVRAVKPLLTGFDPTRPDDSDAAVLLSAMGERLTERTLVAVSPVRFRAPLSPDMAAAREGAPPFDEAVLRFCERALALDGDALLVEGIGGVMVPFGERTTVRDWIAALGLETVVVASGALGTLSHTLAALEALRVANVSVRCVVLSEDAPLPVPLEETRSSLLRYLPSLRVALLPRIEGPRPWERAPDLWAAAME